MTVSPERDALLVAGELSFHCVQWGRQGTAIICVHGLTANAFFFQALADDLSRNHRVFAYDLRGRGDSDRPEHGYSVPIHADDLAKLMDELRLEQPVVIGHSLGAMISLYFAAHYPEKLSRLVLIDAGAPLAWKTPEEQPAWLTASINRLGTPVASYEEYTQRLKAAPFLGPYWNKYTEIYFQHDVRQQSDGSVVSKCHREGILEEGLRYWEAKLEEQWGQVRVPTLILRAGQGLFSDSDQVMTEEAAATVRKAIRDSRLVNFSTLNHYTILLGVEPGSVDTIRAFIDEG